MKHKRPTQLDLFDPQGDPAPWFSDFWRVFLILFRLRGWLDNRGALNYDWVYVEDGRELERFTASYIPDDVVFAMWFWTDEATPEMLEYHLPLYRLGGAPFFLVRVYRMRIAVLHKAHKVMWHSLEPYTVTIDKPTED